MIYMRFKIFRINLKTKYLITLLSRHRHGDGGRHVDGAKITENCDFILVAERPAGSWNANFHGG